MTGEPQLTPPQREAVLAAAAEILTATAQHRSVQLRDRTLGGAADVPVMGCFVTARRSGKLRGCCGFMGTQTSIARAIEHAARRTPVDDPRFPPISPSELPFLHLDVWLLFDPQPMIARGEARREAVEIGKHGLQVVRGNNRGLLLPGVAVDHQLDAESFLAHTCRKAGLPPDAWKDDDVQVFTFAGVAIEGDMPPDIAASSEPDIREPAVAGTFYPSDPAKLSQMVDGFLTPARRASEGQATKPYPAIMVPHAGLKYSGPVAAEVFRRTEIPSTVIVIGPKHTPYGVDYAVAPHDEWSIPGGALAGDPQLARQIVAAVPELELDAAAHAKEHAIEVELPFLARLAPQAKVVGIAIGPGDYETCRRIAEGLAGVLRQRQERTLLVISSDMNHFADDAENRRLDELALACIDRLDPQGLLATCRKHRISMCGVLPAVIVMETVRELGQLNRAERVAYATSGDVSGDRDRVVGYAGVVFE
jgi:AmmeMemoRadiSam system protein B/AmmeMemoRadiSam system protein A